MSLNCFKGYARIPSRYDVYRSHLHGILPALNISMFTDSINQLWLDKILMWLLAFSLRNLLLAEMSTLTQNIKTARSREKKTVSAHLHSMWPQLDLQNIIQSYRNKNLVLWHIFFLITKSWKPHNLQKTYYSMKFLIHRSWMGFTFYRVKIRPNTQAYTNINIIIVTLMTLT